MQRWNSCSGALSKGFTFILFVFGADGRDTCRRIPFTSAHLVAAGEKTSPHCNGCGWQGHRITLNTSLGFGRLNEHIILTAGLQQGDELAGGPSRSADNNGVKWEFLPAGHSETCEDFFCHLSEQQAPLVSFAVRHLCRMLRWPASFWQGCSPCMGRRS